MSLNVINDIWVRFPHGGARLVVMQALADIGNDYGENIWPGNAFLAAKARLSERQLRRVIEMLLAEAWLFEVDDSIPGRKIVEDRYRINIEKLSICPPLLKQKNSAPRSKKKPDILDKKADISDIKADTISPESAPVSQNAPEPYNHITKGKAEKPSDKQGAWAPPCENREQALINWIAHLRKLPERMQQPEELSRAKTELDAIQYEKTRQQVLIP